MKLHTYKALHHRCILTETTKWLRFANNTFVVWPHGPARLQQFFDHINSVRPTNKFTMGVEAYNTLQFLEVLVMKRGSKLIIEVYRKPTHTGRYLHFKSNHPHHVKRGAVHSLVNRAKVICQNQKDFNNEIQIIRHDLMINEYPKKFTDSIMKLSHFRHSITGRLSSHILRALPRNSGASGTVIVSKPSSRLNIRSMGH
jgi:hypothetical protein